MKLCVIGLSSFGHEVASTLASKGIEVLALDKDKLKVEALRDKVTQAICIDIDSEEALKTVGVDEMDTVIICLGKNFEDAVLLTRLIKEELKVPRVITRTSDTERQEILELVGADDVLLPEKEAAKILANKILSKFPNQIPLTDEFSIISISIPEDLIEKNIESINFPDSYKVNCIGIMRGEKIIPPKNHEILKEDDIIYLSGKNKNLANLLKL
jgi:trk system potassium uptake protein